MYGYRSASSQNGRNQTKFNRSPITMHGQLICFLYRKKKLNILPKIQSYAIEVDTTISVCWCSKTERSNRLYVRVRLLSAPQSVCFTDRHRQTFRWRFLELPFRFVGDHGFCVYDRKSQKTSSKLTLKPANFRTIRLVLFFDCPIFFSCARKSAKNVRTSRRRLAVGFSPFILLEIILLVTY